MDLLPLLPGIEEFNIRLDDLSKYYKGLNMFFLSINMSTFCFSSLKKSSTFSPQKILHLHFWSLL